MTDEAYLRACGWAKEHQGETLPVRWFHARHGCGFTRTKAVEVQLAEDRARFAFVLHRTPPLQVSERGEAAANAALGAIMEEHRPGGRVPTGAARR